MGQRMSELAGSPCNRRKTRFYLTGIFLPASIFSLPRRFFCLFFSRLLEEALFLKAGSVSQQGPYGGQQLAGDGDEGDLRGLALLEPKNHARTAGEVRAATCAACSMIQRSVAEP